MVLSTKRPEWVIVNVSSMNYRRGQNGIAAGNHRQVAGRSIFKLWFVWNGEVQHSSNVLLIGLGLAAVVGVGILISR
jgi:hypothetical protein